MKLYQIDGVGISIDSKKIFMRVLKKESHTVPDTIYTLADMIKNEIVIHFGYEKEIELRVLASGETENQIELKVTLYNEGLMVNKDSFIDLSTNDLFCDLFSDCDLYDIVDNKIIKSISNNIEDTEEN